MEIMGHEIEVQAANMFYNVNVSKYRKEEAERMRNGYSGLFKKFSVADLEEAMKDRAIPARQWVRDNERKILKAMKKRYK